jgi:predicted permease
MQMPFSKRNADLDEEIQAHLKMAAQDHVDQGKSHADARVSAIREFGNIPMVKDVTHGMWSWTRLESLVHDLRYAYRHLKNVPAFSLTVIFTLSLGLGATTAMYTVVDRVLLRPLPYRDPDRLIDIKEDGRKGLVDTGAAYYDINQWKERSHSLESLSFYNSNSHFGHLMYLEGSSGDIQVEAPTISANLFSTLGVYPSMGRVFEQAGNTGAVSAADENAVILSDSVWRSTFGSDPLVLGKVIKMNGAAKQIIGVMPPSFTFPFGGSNPVVWTPIVLSKDDIVQPSFDVPRYLALGRLKPNVTLASLEAELKAIQSVVSNQYADPYEHAQVTSVRVQRYGNSLTEADLRTSLLALFGASGILWLIACINATSLILARGTVRQREIALRAALGASRGRIIQQLLIESLVLSFAASLLGLVLAVLTLQLFRHQLISQFSITAQLLPNVSVIGLLVCLTVATGLLSTIWPALATVRASYATALRQGGSQSSAGKKDFRTRSALMVVEVAMSLTLLVGCGLLLRTMYALHHVPLGFRTDHVIVANMAIPAFKFSGKDMTSELYLPLLDSVTQLRGVQSATLMTEVPLGKTFRLNFSFQVKGKAAADIRKRELKSQLRVVGPNAQKVFGFKMWKGRYFDASDTPTSLPVAVVNRAFAKAYTGDNDHPETILGESLLPFGKEKRAVVIGILDDTRQRSVAESSEPEIQITLSQLSPDSLFYRPAEGMAMDLAVRTELQPNKVIPDLRRLMRNASPELSSSSFMTMDQVVEDSYGNQELAARLLEIFAGTALVLSITGIYGLLAYLVGHRKKELGLRVALGAQRGNILWLILSQAAWMLSVGSAVGLGLAFLSSLLLRSFLYGVEAHDPWTMMAVTFLLFGGGMIAAYIPATKAAGIEPMIALRSE